MIPDLCSFCKGKLVKGKTEFMARAGNEVVVIKDVPAWVCEQCGESYFTAAVSRRIDAIMRDAQKGTLCLRPLPAGETDLEA